jgi:predicted ATPase
MLKEIRLKNFKCFREETIFPLSTINLLTGINGRGKSTLLQSMLLMKQSVEHNEYTNKLILNGNCVNLGTYEDIRNYNSDVSQKIEFLFTFERFFSIEKIEISAIISSHTKSNRNPKLELGDEEEMPHLIELITFDNPTLGNMTEQSMIELAKNALDLKTEEELEELDEEDINVKLLLEKAKKIYNKTLANAFSKIHYTAADRLGSQEYYKKINLNDFISVDKKGENLATVLFELKEELVNDKLYLGKDAKNLITQIGEWLSQIFDTNVKIELKEISFIFELLFILNTQSHRPNNVGFGYSYILPIIVSSLIAKEGEIVIIENPEAHLHPKAQSELTKFLAKVASCGVQIFIESHSEHILRGLQVSILKEDIEINEKDVNILYFHSEKEKDSNFTQIPINADGSIENWPNDFFDQADKDYKILFGF